MDYQYYKRLFISIAGIYIVYLNYGLVQERMYFLYSLFEVVIDIKVLMEVVLNIRLFYWLFNVQSI